MKHQLEILLLSFSLFLYANISLSQVVPDFKVNDDTTSRNQFNARLDVDNAGNFTVVWRDERNGRVDVYCQMFTHDAKFLRNNFRVNINLDSSGSPDIATAKNGNFAVCWLDVNNSSNIVTKVKCRIFNNSGIPLTGEIIVNDTIGTILNTPSIGVSNSNQFIITWSHGNILYQRIDSSGNKIGSNKIVNDIGGYYHENPEIAVKHDGSFIVTWSDTRPPSQTNFNDIYMQMFDRFGNRLGINERVNDDLDPLNLQRFPRICSDSFNNFIIAWSDGRLNPDEAEVYSQMYDNNGNKIGINFRVTQSSSTNAKSICNVVTKPGGDFLVGWSEFRPNIPQPYFQRYTNTGMRIGNNFLVTSEEPSTNKYYSDVKIFNDRVISVWTDERNGPFDVYCNIRSYSNPDTIVGINQISSLIPDSFTLNQNYPNPFNPSTNISFSIPVSGIVTIKIYDITGREIKILVNETKETGRYEVKFDGSNLSSGVYFYKIESGSFMQSRRMVLLK